MLLHCAKDKNQAAAFFDGQRPEGCASGCSSSQTLVLTATVLWTHHGQTVQLSLCFGFTCLVNDESGTS